MQQFIEFVRGLGALGYVVYTLGYAVIGLVVPASVLTIGAGALFGIIGGSIVVAIGATLTATLAFLLARTILRKRIERMVARNPKFAAVDRAIAREGAKIVILVRLAAVFPFLFVNYAFGLTGIGTLRYMAATFVGILPGTIAFVYLGAAAADAATASRTKMIVTIAGAVIALAVSIYVGRIARRALLHDQLEDADDRADVQQ
ncbi:MAG TPA: TVP38/TMEM64 family protein [Thermoanaerobaculia bacterium]|nr:TVP38/TMEM64 family protein [Thermoanaerobaculia bacterium]